MPSSSVNRVSSYRIQCHSQLSNTFNVFLMRTIQFSLITTNIFNKCLVVYGEAHESTALRTALRFMNKKQLAFFYLEL